MASLWGNTQPDGWDGEHVALKLACNNIYYSADGKNTHRGIYAYLKINNSTVSFKHTKYGIPTGKPVFIAVTVDTEKTSENVTFSVRYFNDDGSLAEYSNANKGSMDLTQIDFGKSVGGNPFAFGVTNYGGRFVGDVSRASIYSDIRTSEELTADFLNGCDINDEALIAGYDLHAYNQGSVVIKDKSKYENDLSFTGANNSGLKFSEFEGYPLSKPLATTPKTLEFRYSSTEQLSNSHFCGNTIMDAERSAMSLVVQSSDGNLRLYFNDIITGKSYSIVFPDTKQYFNTGGEWYHLAVVIDDAAYTYRLYINGAEVSKVEADKDTFVNLDTLCHDLPLSIGNQGANGGNNSFFTGSMQDVVFYSDVRTPEEILLDYSKDYDPTDVNMMAMFNLNMSVEGVNGLVDNTGNGYDLRTDIWLDEDEVPEPEDYAYSFAVVGDTQILSGHTNNWNNKYGALSRENMNSLYKWILDNQEKYNIQHVFGVGDIVESYDEANAINEWEKAKPAIEQMNGKISYTLVRGDSHDYSPYMNQYLGTEEYYSMFKPGESEFPTRDSEGNVKMDTGYRTFTVGEEKYLFLMLDCSPERELIEWGEKVIKAHPFHKVILTTHMYMDGKGELNTHGGNMWDAYKDEPNMFMVLCGHSGNHDDNIVVRQDRGTNGNLVTTMMINPQNMDRYAKNVGGYGMVAMLYFSKDGKTVSVRYTTTNGYENPDERTTPFVKYFKPENQFDIVVDDTNKITEITGDASSYRVQYTDGTYADFTPDTPLADVNGYKLNLKGDIGVKPYLNVPKFASYDKLSVKFTVDGAETVIPFSKAEVNAEYGYGFECLVNATQMTSAITIELYYDDILLVTDTYSVAKYAETIMTDDAYADAREVVKAMLNYGGLSQEYFGIEASDPAEGYEYTTELDSVTLDAIKSLSVNKASGAVNGVKYTGSWLELRSTLVLYHSFEVTGNIADYTFKCGDKVLTPIHMGGNTYAIAVTEVYAQNMATEYAVTVNDAYTLTYNAMNYIKLAYNDASLNDLVSALYLYYAEANAYFN